MERLAEQSLLALKALDVNYRGILGDSLVSLDKETTHQHQARQNMSTELYAHNIVQACHQLLQIIHRLKLIRQAFDHPGQNQTREEQRNALSETCLQNEQLIQDLSHTVLRACQELEN